MNQLPDWQQFVIELLVAWTLLLGGATLYLYSLITKMRSELAQARKMRWWHERGEQQKYRERI